MPSRKTRIRRCEGNNHGHGDKLSIGVPNPANTPWNPAGTTWLDPGTFLDEGTEFFDPVQGGLADCWLIAALAAVAWARPYAQPGCSPSRPAPFRQYWARFGVVK
jgi:Calpain family cysteine protease